MPQPHASPQWRCFGQSVRGSSHLRSGLPNQDAILWSPGYPEMGVGASIVLAISDGHGSPKNFRSAIGSQYAVEVACRIVRDYFLVERADLSRLKDIVERALPQQIVAQWTRRVRNHWQANSIEGDPSWEKLQPSAQTAILNAPEIAYGATLLMVIVTDRFIVYLQLGDGDILCIYTNHPQQPKRPLPIDPRLIANETTSLCMPDAWEEFRVQLQPYSSDAELPSLILMSTDGYANSYSSEAEFSKIGADYLDMMRNGVETLIAQLPSFLQETSQHGSGDDITLGLIHRLEKHPPSELAPTMLEQQKRTGNFQELAESQKRATLRSTIALLCVGILSIVILPLFAWLLMRTSTLEAQHQEQTKRIERLQEQLAKFSEKEPPATTYREAPVKVNGKPQ